MIWIVEWMAEYDAGGKGVWRPWITMEENRLELGTSYQHMDLKGDDLTEVIDRLINKEHYEDVEDGFHVRIRNTETGEVIPLEALCL